MVEKMSRRGDGCSETMLQWEIWSEPAKIERDDHPDADSRSVFLGDGGIKQSHTHLDWIMGCIIFGLSWSVCVASQFFFWSVPHNHQTDAEQKPRFIFFNAKFFWFLLWHWKVIVDDDEYGELVRKKTAMQHKLISSNRRWSGPECNITVCDSA
jgi:hypothetical protein